MSREYDDFEVQVLPYADGKHWVEVRSRQGDDARTVDFRPETFTQQLPAISAGVTRSSLSRGRLNPAQIKKEEFARFGRALFERLLPDTLTVGGMALLVAGSAALLSDGIDKWACNPTCSPGWASAKSKSDETVKGALWTSLIGGGGLAVIGLSVLAVSLIVGGTGDSAAGSVQGMAVVPTVGRGVSGVELHLRF